MKEKTEVKIEDKIKDIYNELVKKEKLVHRFRNKSNFLKIYYHGQKMYDIYKDKIKITNSVLNIPSKYFGNSDKTKENHWLKANIIDEEKIEAIINEYTNELKSKVYELEKYYNYQIKKISLATTNKLKNAKLKEMNETNICNLKDSLKKYSGYNFYNRLITELDKLKDYLKTDLHGEIPVISPVKVNESDKLSLKKLLTLECLLQYYTIGKTPFKKTKIEKEIEVKKEIIYNYDKFNKLTNALKEGIDDYNNKNGSLKEKQFQDLLMQEPITKKISIKLSKGLNINLNLLPLEEEFGICVDTKTNQKFYEQHKDDDFIEESNYLKSMAEDDKEYKQAIGRVDNVYLNGKEILFVEVKINHSVIRYKDHGIAKHLEDMYKWGSNNNSKRNKSIENMLKGIDKRKQYNKPLEDNILLIGNKNKDYCNLIKNYYIICGYEDGTFMDEENNEEITYYDKILDIMNEPKEKEHIIEFMNLLKTKNDGIKLDTKIILVKVLKNDKTYSDIDENSIEVVEYNSFSKKFETKKL